MSGYSVLLLSMALLLLGSIAASHNQNGCGRQRCGPDGPPIRFPFRLKDREPPHCGYHGFDLTCSHDNDTLFEFSDFPVRIKLLVTRIEYEYNFFEVSNPEDRFRRQLLKINLTSISESRFRFHQYEQQDLYNMTFLYCSPDVQHPPFSGIIYDAEFSDIIYVADDSATLLNSNLLSCTKMFDISSIFRYAQGPVSNDLTLWWSKPDCMVCEINGRRCRLKKNGTEGAVECFGKISDPKSFKKILLYTTGVALGSLLLVLVAVALFKIYQDFRMKGEDRARIEKFLEDYKALKPTRFSYADIKRITNGFKEKLGEGAHGAVFKGKLSSEIIVAVKILSNTEGEGKDFTNEVGTMGKIHHINVVRLLGFCAEGFRSALVYDFFPKGSLQNFISTPDNKDIFLGWEKLHQIALGVARGIEYLHHGCEQQILHFDINPHNVLVDDKLTPKITDFGLAKLCSKNQSAVSMTAARGTLGYIAPEVVSRNFGKVSYKSDIYSYGMLLLEMVGGRKNMEMVIEGPFQNLYPEWVYNLLDGGDIHLHIEDEEDIKIAKKIAIVGLWCIQWHPSDRPSIKTVVKMLEGDGDKLTVPRNPFNSTSSVSRGLITTARRLNLELEVIRE